MALTSLTPVTPLWAQDIRPRLEARGLPSELIDEVTAIAADATAQGLPTTPLADKAIEGFAKSVPSARIVAVVRQYGARMLDARAAVQGAGVPQPEGILIAAATDAMGRGLVADEIGRVVRAGPHLDLAPPGLTVAAALTAQGMPTAIATDVVAQAIQSGSTAAQILDLPSIARAWQAEGLTPGDAGRAMMRGGRPGVGAPARPDGPRPGPGGLSRPPRTGPDGRPAGPGAGPAPQRPGAGRPGGGLPTRP